MTKLYVNGKFATVNDDAPFAEAVAIDDGKFTFVGTMEELAASGLDDGTAEKVDLEGKFVIPGIVDSHQHIGLTALYSGLAGNPQPYILTETKAEALKQIKEFVNEHPEYDRYKCSAGSKEAWGEMLTRAELDEICPDKFLGVSDAGGHSITINTALMNELGIDENTPDPVPGFCFYERDEEGKPTGLLVEHVQWAPIAKLDSVPHDAIAPAIKQLLDYDISRGITGVYDAGITYREDEVTGIIREMDDNGEIPVHFSTSHTIFLPDMVDDAISEQLRIKKEYEGGNIYIDTLKVFIDGTASECSAFVKDPYPSTGKCADSLFTLDEMCKFFAEANDNNTDIHLHTIGDGASERVADVVEKLVEDGVDFKSHVTLAHCQLITPEAREKIKKYGLYIDMTPSWLDGPAPGGFWYQDTDKLSPENKKRSYLLRSNMEAAGNFTLSADCPVAPAVKEYMWNPYFGMELACTRYMADTTGPDEECCGNAPEERLTIEEALKAYTINGAKQLNWEDMCGSIEVGKSADMAVLDRNLFEIPITDVHNALPELVLFKGDVVFEK